LELDESKRSSNELQFEDSTSEEMSTAVPGPKPWSEEYATELASNDRRRVRTDAEERAATGAIIGDRDRSLRAEPMAAPSSARTQQASMQHDKTWAKWRWHEKTEHHMQRRTEMRPVIQRHDDAQELKATAHMMHARKRILKMHTLKKNN